MGFAVLCVTTYNGRIYSVLVRAGGERADVTMRSNCNKLGLGYKYRTSSDGLVQTHAVEVVYLWEKNKETIISSTICAHTFFPSLFCRVYVSCHTCIHNFKTIIGTPITTPHLCRAKPASVVHVL